MGRRTPRWSNTRRQAQTRPRVRATSPPETLGEKLLTWVLTIAVVAGTLLVADAIGVPICSRAGCEEGGILATIGIVALDLVVILGLVLALERARSRRR